MNKNLLLLKDLVEPERFGIKFMTLIPKEAYIDKLDDIVNKYDNTYHTTIEMKTFDVTLTKKRMIMILNIKLTIM